MISAAVNMASMLPEQMSARLRFQQIGSIEALSASDQSFDGILCSSVIE